MRHGSGAAAAHAVRCSRLVAAIEERVERRDGHAFVLRRPIRTRLARTLVRGHPVGIRLARATIRGHPVGSRLVRAIVRGHPVGIGLVRASVRPHHLVRAFARTKHGPGGACAQCMSILERRVGGACEACTGKRHQGEHRSRPLAAVVFRPAVDIGSDGTRVGQNLQCAPVLPCDGPFFRAGAVRYSITKPLCMPSLT